MEENPLQQTPALPDLAATQGCKIELTRSNSYSSSSLTVEDSKNTYLQNEVARPDNCTAWTDEKHKLYLDHLESSFVEQLHRSMGLIACCSEKNAKGPSFSRKRPANIQNTSEQFTVVQDGCWKKIDVKGNQPILNSAADPLAALKSPWIRHFRCAGKRRIVTSALSLEYSALPTRGMCVRQKRTFSNELATSSEQVPLTLRCHEESVDCIKEFSDQNFADEDRDEKASTSMPKISKTALAEASSQDQIVPVREFHVTEISALGHSSSEREQQEHQGSLHNLI